MADFKPQDFLSGNVTATDVERQKKKELILVGKELDAEIQVEGISKAEVKAILLHALAEKNLLKGTMRTRGLESDLELQLELKRLELEEKREERGFAEREAERRRQFDLQKAREESEFRLREMETKTQLSEQEGKVLKKDQIARSMSLVLRFDEREMKNTS